MVVKKNELNMQSYQNPEFLTMSKRSAASRNVSRPVFEREMRLLESPYISVGIDRGYRPANSCYGACTYVGLLYVRTYVVYAYVCKVCVCDASQGLPRHLWSYYSIAAALGIVVTAAKLPSMRRPAHSCISTNMQCDA